MAISTEWLGFAGTGLCVLAYLPQILHLFRERCAAGLSQRAYCTWAIATLLLLSHSINMQDPVFILLQAYQLGATSVICYFCIKYRGRLCDEHKDEPFAELFTQHDDLAHLYRSRAQQR